MRPTLARVFMMMFLTLASPALAVDGVIEINQACAATGCFAGDAPGFPVTITTSGSYRLTSNLLRSPASTALIIETSDGTNVAIDLNDFVVEGPIHATAIHDGTIQGNRGVSAACMVDNVKTVQSSIVLGRILAGGNPSPADGCSLTNSTVTQGDSVSICVTAGQRARITNNNIEGCDDARAINAGAWSTIQGNRIRAIGSGILAPNSVIQGNVVQTLTGNCPPPPAAPKPAIQGVRSVVRDNVATAGCGAAILCEFCTVVNNVATDSPRSFGLDDPSKTTGYAGNQFDNNNGGNANPQVAPGAIQIGPNVCGENTTCP